MSEKKMRILSIINLKGGVAKTITSVVFAYILAVVFGYRVDVYKRQMNIVGGVPA